jgi:protein-tyrosine phosphatase
LSLTLYTVPAGTPGVLSIMPCPPQAGLATNLEDLNARGVTSLVSLLTPEDASDLGMEQEEAVCTAAGIRFISHPVMDFCLPAQPGFSQLVRGVTDALKSGENIVAHCRGGIGRSGMLACCVLITLGWEAAAAIAEVTNARHIDVPDTAEQRAFILHYRPGT